MLSCVLVRYQIRPTMSSDSTQGIRTMRPRISHVVWALFPLVGLHELEVDLGTVGDGEADGAATGDGALDAVGELGSGLVV